MFLVVIGLCKGEEKVEIVYIRRSGNCFYSALYLLSVN